MGPIGFAALAVCVCRGWPVTLYGRDPEDSFRAGLARSLGAAYRAGGREAGASLLGDGTIDPDADGFDLILECTGSDDVLVAASRCLASRGVMVWLGSSRTPEPRSLNVAQMLRDAVVRNHLHLGSVNAAPRDFVDALADLDQLRCRKPEALSQWITARVTPADALWHYEHREPQGIKTVVCYA
jgi:threonine dehydrogenase-like Zn-dependent dehydrogenase